MEFYAELWSMAPNRYYFTWCCNCFLHKSHREIFTLKFKKLKYACLLYSISSFDKCNAKFIFITKYYNIRNSCVGKTMEIESKNVVMLLLFPFLCAIRIFKSFAKYYFYEQSTGLLFITTSFHLHFVKSSLANSNTCKMFEAFTYAMHIANTMSANVLLILFSANTNTYRWLICLDSIRITIYC